MQVVFGRPTALALCLAAALYLYINNDTSRQSSRRQEDEQDEQDEFVWSSEIQDWALGAQVKVGAGRSHSSNECIWPDDSNCTGDRIINQLRLKPADRERLAPIRIALANEFADWQQTGELNDCNFRCQLTADLVEAEAVVFSNADISALKLRTNQTRPRGQLWVAQLLESPSNTFDAKFERHNRVSAAHTFNWTAAYRSDADLVTPYSKFVPYADQIHHFLALKRVARLRESSNDSHVEQFQLPPPSRTGRVAWFVSNCHARNKRLEFALELGRHIQVDIYGKCGQLECAKWSQATCLASLNNEYKFYLAFENSNHREYITEKLYQMALGYNDRKHKLLPVVMGAPRADYERLAPPHSFIHVDDFSSAQELARYLRKLDADDKLYATYFKWKSLGRFIDTKFYCRLCALVHLARSEARVKSYANLKQWWLNETLPHL